MSYSNRAPIVSALAVLVIAGGMPARGENKLSPSGTPLSTYAVNPQFDWSDFERRAGTTYLSVHGATQPVLKGAVQRSAMVPPAPAVPLPDTVDMPDGNNAGSQPKLTVHGPISHTVAQDGGGALDQIFAIQTNDSPGNDNQNGRFHADWHKMTAKGKGLLNYMLDYRGFGPSTEAANLILEEHEKSKTLEAKEYFKQRAQDDGRLKAIASIMQIGMGVGMSNTARGQRLVESGLASLKELVGDQNANEILAAIQQSGRALKFPQDLSEQEIWDVVEKDGKIKQIVQSATSSDPVIQKIRHDLHKYNSHSKFAQYSVGLIEAALSIASFTPTFAAPAAETTYLVLMMSTGGPEQDKLVRELYLSKRIESRLKVIREEAHMAIDAYHIALLTENPVMLACAQSLVRQLSGEETVHDVFGQSDLALNAAAKGQEAVYAESPAGKQSLALKGTHRSMKVD